MLKIHQLSKCYPGGIQALQKVSLTCHEGVYGLLGQNGAGKSTLMRTLATLQNADSGEATLDDIDLLRSHHLARQHIGYLPQDMGVYPRMTALETLQYFAGLKGLSRSSELLSKLEQVNLANEANQRLDTFSGGMKRRFGIAVAFLGNPRLVIVDEPTAGLDPFERRRFQYILAEAAQNCILILSSHIVEDIADLADRMAIIHHGQVVAEDSPASLIREMNNKVWTKEIPFEEFKTFQEHYQLLSWRPGRTTHRVRVYSNNHPGNGFTRCEAVLEDFYAYRVSPNSK
ncbi:MAG: ATP-binding cassette domain-containing protein [Verrucomicrobiota bacterium]